MTDPRRRLTSFVFALLALIFSSISFGDEPSTKPAIEREVLKLNVVVFDSTTDLESKTATYKVTLNGEFESGLFGLPIRAAVVEPVSMMAGGKNLAIEAQHPREDEIQRMVSNASQWGGMWKPKAPATMTFTAENQLPMIIGPAKFRAVILKPEKIETKVIEPIAPGDMIRLVPGIDFQITSVSNPGTPQLRVKYTLHVVTPPAWDGLPAWPTQLCSVAAEGRADQPLAATVAQDMKRKKVTDGYEYMGAVHVSAFKEPKPAAILKAEKIEEAKPVELPPIQVDRLKFDVGTDIKPHLLDVGIEKIDLSSLPLLFPPNADKPAGNVEGTNEKGWRVELARMSFRSASGLPTLMPYRYGGEFRLIAPKPDDHFKIVWSSIGYVVAPTPLHDARIAAPQEFPPRKESGYWSLDKAHWGHEAKIVGNFQTYPGEPALVEQINVCASVVTPNTPTTKTIDLVASKTAIDVGNSVMMTIEEPSVDEASKTVRLRLRSTLDSENVQGKPRPNWFGKQITSIIPLDANGREIPTRFSAREHGIVDEIEAGRFQILASLVLPAVNGQLAKPAKLKIETAPGVTWEDISLTIRDANLAVQGLLPTR